MDVLHEACLDGLGLALVSHWNVRADLEAGRLVEVALADAAPEALDIWAVYPSARLVPRKVHAFIGALSRHLA